VLAAAAVAGVDRVFTIGGAQAVAPWPTAPEHPAGGQDRRPGNAYVAEASAACCIVGIDMIAGPRKSS